MTYEKRDHPESLDSSRHQIPQEVQIPSNGKYMCDCDGTGQDRSEVVVNSGAPVIESLAS